MLYGACLGRAGFNRKTALATATMVIAAEIPDLDMVTYFAGGPLYGFQHHRGITHTFVGVPFDAAATMLIIYGAYRLGRWWRERHPLPAARSKPPAPPPRWGLLYLFAVIAGLSHILLDFTNNYGVRPFEPFSYRWYHWDIVFIYEPIMTGVLFVALVLPALFRLIEEEIGAKRGRGRGFAITALVLVAALWGFRDYEHRHAVAALEALDYRGEQPLRASAGPYPTNPFHWSGVVETSDFIQVMNVDSLTPNVDDRHAFIRYKSPDTPVLEAAKTSWLGRVYLDWAEYPVFEVQKLYSNSSDDVAQARSVVFMQDQPNDDANVTGYRVYISDMRYRYADRPGRGRGGLAGSVELDRNLRVVAIYMSGLAQRLSR